jgi:hypothetical protein
VGVEVADESAGLLTVMITGRLRMSDLLLAQASALEAIRRYGKVRLLVVATGFLGWERGSDWSDVSFPAKHDRHIEKIAVVGDKRWEDEVLAFMGKGFRPVSIAYFVMADLPKARAWVGSTP